MPFKLFISSVQREFAEERKLLADYIRRDAILGRFFEVFLFEDVPAQERSASDVYLSEVDASDIYLGILGATYGHVDRKGVSATEREYERAEKKQKERICFVKGYIEKVGSGTRDMIERCREWGIEPPRWENDDGDFAVTLRRIPVAATAEKNAPRTTTHTTTQTTIQTTIDNLGLVGGAASVLRAILSHPTANLKELASLLGMTKDGVFYHVRNLRSIGLKHVGARDRGRWTLDGGDVPTGSDVTEDVARNVTRNAKGVKTTAGTVTEKGGLKNTLKGGLKSGLNKTDVIIVDGIGSNAKLTIPDLMVLTGLSRNGVKKAMERLKFAGVVRRVGPDKGGHWEVVGLK